jgi:hypothetical protein
MRPSRRAEFQTGLRSLSQHGPFEFGKWAICIIILPAGVVVANPEDEALTAPGCRSRTCQGNLDDAEAIRVGTQAGRSGTSTSGAAASRRAAARREPVKRTNRRSRGEFR